MSILKEFKYEKPSSLNELKELLKTNNSTDFYYLAGGTDLLVDMRNEKKTPSLVIDLKGLPDLNGISFIEEKLLIGALTPIHDIEINKKVQIMATALNEGAQNLGSWQVRNRGTIGGNLGNGAPTADTASPLLALDAKLHVWGPKGQREISIDSFWVSAGKTCLKKEELITAVEVPIKKGFSSAYIKVGPRNAMDIAIASCAVSIKTINCKVEEIRIALGGAGPTPIRAHTAETFLIKQPITSQNLKIAGELAAKDSNPRTSNRATREYRLSVIPVIVERAICAAVERQESCRGGDN